jgi:hypothetical protein
MLVVSIDPESDIDFAHDKITMQKKTGVNC